MSSRPRPRPRAKNAGTTVVHTDPTTSSATSPGSEAGTALPPSVTIIDEDAMFLRNRTRTTQSWQKLTKMAVEDDGKKRKSDDSDTDEDPGSSPKPPRKRVAKARSAGDTLPAWTRDPSNAIDISSDEDDDDILATATKDRQKSARSKDGSQGKNRRSRSRSITPPPALPQSAYMYAEQRVRELVGIVARAPSPTFAADTSIDTICGDDEFAAINKRVKSQKSLGSGADFAEPTGGPEFVAIKVRWIPHPQKASGEAKDIGFNMKRHAKFFGLVEGVATEVGVLGSRLVITYDGRKVFPSSTPHGIGIWAEAEFEACDKDTYDYMQANRRLRSPSVAPVLTEDATRRSPSRARSPSTTALSSDSDSEPDPTPSQPDTTGAFHLTCRSGKSKDITLMVRPTTRCGAIVAAFLKKAGLADQYPAPASAPAKAKRGKAAVSAKAYPSLVVDGDKMSPDAEIGEADLEDGDQVEIVGL